MADLTPKLSATLDLIAAACRELADPWWVFGSAAMALAGVPGLSPPDVDLIVSEADAGRLLRLWNLAPEPPSRSDLFRSRIFAKAKGAPLTIEIMAGFEVNTTGGWRPVRPRTRVAAQQNGAEIYIPSAAEQAEICRLFGRPKDLDRLPALEALS